MPTPYLYQILHTRGYVAPRLEEHCRVLEYYYGRLYCDTVRLDRGDIATQIECQLQTHRVIKNLSTHVELRLNYDKSIEVSIFQTTIYEGFALRCFAPFAIAQRYDNPFGDYPTSARRAASDWAHHTSKLQGGDISIRVDRDNMVCSCGDYPLFGVRGGHIFTPPAPMSVERSMAVSAARLCGYELFEESIFLKQLSLFDELFWVDAYGVTAISQVDKRCYMSVVAEKIASKLG